MQRSKEAMLESLQGSFAISGMHLTAVEIARARAQLDGTLSVDDAIAEVYLELRSHKAAKQAIKQSDI